MTKEVDLRGGYKTCYDNRGQKPLFSIGVVTYNREKMLKECISSILRQTFSDFEVIIGNDYPRKTVSDKSLGVRDPRFRFINHAHNLGELNNLNFLLATSRGRYFTWLGDDDMYAPTFLKMIHSALEKFDFPPCVFTSYMQGEVPPDKLEEIEGEIQVFDRQRFLQEYLSRQLKVIGCYGVFDRQYLQQLGGMEQLGNGFSPYADNLLAIKAGLQKKVVYIDVPLIFFRTHEQSISYTSPDVDAYSSAQKDLLAKSLEVFSGKELSDSLRINLFLLLKWCLANYCTVMHRSGSLQFGKLVRYTLFLMSYLKKLKGYRCKMILIILHRTNKLIIQMAKQSFKNRLSLNLQRT